MNVLITGASGMLGATLANQLKHHFNIYATGNSIFQGQHHQYKRFDLKNDCYNELIKWANPDIIIHCAAITNGNYCEENYLEAFNINGFSMQKLLKATNEGVKIIYISTDAVFPSSLHLAKESDHASPENIYGKSKELGEFFLKSSINRSFIIIRTTIVGMNLNPEKSSFIEWIINSSQEKNKIGLFTDVLFTPISIWDLAKEIKFILDRGIVESEVVHISGELCTKFQFGNKLMDRLNLSTDLIYESKISSYVYRAKRSNDQSLDSSYYCNKYERKLPNLEQTISNITDHYELNKTR